MLGFSVEGAQDVSYRGLEVQIQGIRERPVS